MCENPSVLLLGGITTYNEVYNIVVLVVGD